MTACLAEHGKYHQDWKQYDTGQEPDADRAVESRVLRVDEIRRAQDAYQDGGSEPRTKKLLSQ
jgi:hypothetical protein